MSNSNSPEEKLLRLIKGQKPKDAVLAPALRPAARPLTAGPAVKTPAVKAPVIKVALSERMRRMTSFFTFDRLIAIALVCSSIYLVVSLAGAMLGSKKSLSRDELEKNIPVGNASQSLPSDDDEVVQEKKPVDYYTQATAGKHLFAVEAAPSQEVQVPQSALNNDAIKDINVIGIIADVNPQVIIEDKKSQKTVYVGKGQSIGDFIVEDIKEGKVILNCKGQKFELSM